ncbi:unnamed protein product [Merluccius merluccius]
MITKKGLCTCGSKSATSSRRASGRSLAVGCVAASDATVGRAISHGHAGSECFSTSSSSSSSSTYSSTLLLLAAQQPGRSPSRYLSRVAVRLQTSRGLGFSTGPRGSGGGSSDRARLNQTLQHPHTSYRTTVQKWRQRCWMKMVMYRTGTP